MVNTTEDKPNVNQNKSLFLKKGLKFDYYMLNRKIKEYKLGTAIGAVFERRLA